MVFLFWGSENGKSYRETEDNVGILTGPLFFAAIAEYTSGTTQLAIQGIDFPVEVGRFLVGGSVIGNAVMYSPPSSQAFLHQTLKLKKETPGQH